MTTSKIADILADGPVIPVIVIEDVAHAVPLAQALVAGGVRVLEVTLADRRRRWKSIRRMIAEVPDAHRRCRHGADGAQLDEVADAGAAFAVSPGATPALLEAAAAIRRCRSCPAPPPRAR